MAGRLKPRRPLTAAQQRLCSDPAALSLAARIAARLTRNARPATRDEAHSAALYGLVIAAGQFDPAAGLRFSTFAAHKVRGAVLDALRMHAPAGCRRNGRRPPKVVGCEIARGRGDTASADDPPTLADLPSADLPVGWEVDAADAVEALAARLRPQSARVVRAYYLEAGATLDRIGRRSGLSQSRLSQILRPALAHLRGSA